MILNADLTKLFLLLELSIDASSCSLLLMISIKLCYKSNCSFFFFFEIRK